MNSTHHPPSCTPLPRWSRPRSVRPSPWRTRSSSCISSQTVVSWGRSSCWSPPVQGARSCPYHTPPPSRHCRSGKCRTGQPPPVIQQNIVIKVTENKPPLHEQACMIVPSLFLYMGRLKQGSK